MALIVNGVRYPDVSGVYSSIKFQIMKKGSNQALYLDDDLGEFTVSPGEISAIEIEGRPLNLRVNV